MKKLIGLLVLTISSNIVMADTLLWDCQNKYGDTVATLGYPRLKDELILKVKVEPGFVPAFSAVKIATNVYEGRNGLFQELRPVLDLNKRLLTINKKIIQVECFNGQEGGE